MHWAPLLFTCQMFFSILLLSISEKIQGCTSSCLQFRLSVLWQARRGQFSKVQFLYLVSKDLWKCVDAAVFLCSSMGGAWHWHCFVFGSCGGLWYCKCLCFKGFGVKVPCKRDIYKWVFVVYFVHVKKQKNAAILYFHFSVAAYMMVTRG